MFDLVATRSKAFDLLLLFAAAAPSGITKAIAVNVNTN